MDARVKKIREILAAPGDQYLVPFFQRQYSWRRNEWTRLWDDLMQLLEHGDGANQHFLGPLVCTPTPHVPGEVTPYLLIDGQQRLTTITVLLAALRDWAAECGLADLAEEVTEEYLIHKRKKKLDRYRLLPRMGDREILVKIIEGETKGMEVADNLLRARRFFRKRVQTYSEEKSEFSAGLQLLFNAIRDRLSLVVITIDGENPYEIFESLNSTGLPLAQSDLIRNFVFMQVPLEAQEDFNEECWQPLEAQFEEPPLDPTRFYRRYLMREGRYSLKNATFVDFKDDYRRRELNPSELVSELEQYAGFERWLTYPETCSEPALSEALAQLSAVEATTAHSLVMNLLAKHQSDELSGATLIGCVTDLVSFIVRRSICGESTRQYSKWFVEAIARLGEEPQQGLRRYLLERGWPDDDAFKAALGQFSLYRRERGKARLMLEALERSFDHKEQVQLDSTISIEHVMPQTINDDEHGRSWKTMLGEKWQETHDTLLHTLGNLTLTGYNPSLSNHSYAEKRQLLKKSHLELNKHFHELEAWTAEAMQTRGRLLGERLAKLWRRPDGVAYIPTPDDEVEEETAKGTIRRKDLYLAFWSKLIDQLESRDGVLGLPKLRRGPRVRIPAGKKAHWLVFRVRPKRRKIAVGFRTVGAAPELKFARVKPYLPDLEKEFGLAVEWDEREVYINRPDSNVLDRDEWTEHHEWLITTAERLHGLLQAAIQAASTATASDIDAELTGESDELVDQDEDDEDED